MLGTSLVGEGDLPGWIGYLGYTSRQPATGRRPLILVEVENLDGLRDHVPRIWMKVKSALCLAKCCWERMPRVGIHLRLAGRGAKLHPFDLKALTPQFFAGFWSRGQESHPALAL